MSNNGDSGLSIDARDGSNIGTLLVQGNNIESNQSLSGITMFVSTDSSISSAPTGGIIGNQINNNVGSNIDLTLNENATATLYIQDNNITGARAVANSTSSIQQGDGINIDLSDTAVMNNGGVIHNNITGNARDGLHISIIGNNDAGNVNTIAAQLNNFVIGSTTAGQGNLFQGNGDDGLEISRAERGQFNNLLVQNNIFNSNIDDGMIVNVSGASQGNMLNLSPDSMDVNINDFTSNGGDGIEFRLEADADLVANLDQNVITRNAEDGIYVSENINDARDSRSLTGAWTRNNISRNTMSGIQIQSWVGNTTNDPEAGMGLIIGSTTINPVGTQDPMGNVISRNGLDGIQYTGVGVMTIGNNVITLNGTENTDPITGALLGTYNNAGINIQGQEVEDEGAVYHSGEFPISFDDENAPGRAAQEVNVLSNLISQNIGDGIRWLNEGGHDAFNLRLSSGPPQAAITSSLNIRNNEITINEGRGISAITRPEDTDTTDIDDTDPKASSSRFTNIELSREVIGDLTIIGNHVKGNKLEGIYVVTTNSSNQSIVSQSRDLLEETGSVIAQVNLRADIHNNEIIGNGSEVIDFPATGLVVRVGSSGGGYSQLFAGGFATTGTNLEDTNNDGVLDVDLDGNGVLSATTNFNAGISMSVTGNTFDGNAGDDVLFHSFRSTVDPGAASGTWTETEFSQTGYSGDPLARMDLIFSNNAFSSIEGNNLDTTITDNFQVGAYYNDPDGIFKSRLFAASDPSSGPFTDAARIRNAQRLGARFGLAPNPSVPPGTAGLLYAGIGQSTFRVRGTGNAYTDQGLGAVNIADIFILDDVPFNSVGSANGVFPVSPNATGGGGESPWGWGGF